jgi:hypothetical protein
MANSFSITTRPRYQSCEEGFSCEMMDEVWAGKSKWEIQKKVEAAPCQTFNFRGISKPHQKLFLNVSFHGNYEMTPESRISINASNDKIRSAKP